MVRRRVGRALVVVQILALAALGACADGTPSPDAVGVAEARLISGRDDRLPPQRIADLEFAADARRFVAALVERERVVEDAGVPALDGEPLYAWHEENFDVELCRDERFALEPTPAFCSGTLIAPDLVLTAGHCVVTHDDCEATAIVFGFEADAAGVIQPLRAQDLYACAEILAGSGPDHGDPDYALIKIDRAVPDREPASVVLDARSIPLGLEVSSAGHPIGLPLKITMNGVTRPSPFGFDLQEPNYFAADIDTFPGNSGSGAYLTATENPHPLVGVLSSVVSRGSYQLDEQRACDRYTRWPVVDVWFSYAHFAISALCEQHAASYPALCGCGDDACNAAAGENGTTCATDCGGGCGDHVCLAGETPQSCVADCAVCGDGTCSFDEDCCGDCGCADGFACAGGRCVAEQAPGAGYTCQTAIPLASAPGATTTVAGSTSGAERLQCETDADFSCFGPERHYAFTLAQPSSLVATARGFDHIALALRSAPCGGGALIGAAADRSGAGEARLRRVLQPGSYVLRIDGELPYDSGDYELDVEFTAPPVAHGDTCAEPIALAPTGSYSVAGNTASTPNVHRPAASLACSVSSYGNDTVYSLTLTEKTRLVASVTAAHGATLALTALASSGECGDALRCERASAGIRRVLDPGAYLLIVGGEASFDAGAYTLNVALTTSPTPEGESCEDALVLDPVGQQQLTGDVTGLGSDVHSPCSAASGSDRVHTFTLAEPRTVRIEAEGALGAIAELSDACPSTGGAQCFTLGPQARSQNRTLAPGTYFLVVDRASAASGGYELAIDFESEPMGESCSDPLPFAIGAVPSTVTAEGHETGASKALYYGFTLSEASAVELAAAEPAVFWLSSSGQTVYAASGELATSLPPGAYCVQLQAPLGGPSLSLTASAVALGEPEGRGCADAIAIDASGAQRLNGFANFGPLASCSAFPAHVYAFELTEASVLRASIGSAFAIALYSDEACSELAHCTSPSGEVEESLPPGSYKLAVAGPPFAPYQLDLSFDCAPDSDDEACVSDEGPVAMPDAAVPDSPDAATDGGTEDAGATERPDAAVDAGVRPPEGDAAMQPTDRDDDDAGLAFGEPPRRRTSDCVCSAVAPRSPSRAACCGLAVFGFACAYRARRRARG